MNIIKVKYHNANIEQIKEIPEGNWIDLRASVTVELKAGDYSIIPLGVSIKLPDGYEGHLAPRSSTFKNWGIIQTNSVGVIDNSYCGENDIWGMPVYATRDTVIKENDRICQFRIMKVMGDVRIEKVDTMEDADRGGFGSTGTN